MDEIYGKVLPDIWLKLATQTIAQAGQVSPVTTLRTGRLLQLGWKPDRGRTSLHHTVEKSW